MDFTLQFPITTIIGRFEGKKLPRPPSKNTPLLGELVWFNAKRLEWIGTQRYWFTCLCKVFRGSVLYYLPNSVFKYSTMSTWGRKIGTTIFYYEFLIFVDSLFRLINSLWRRFLIMVLVEEKIISIATLSILVYSSWNIDLAPYKTVFC